MLVLPLVFLLILGLIVGSFLNVLIYRLEGKKRKTLGGRSFCPKCEKKIPWHDNIPIVSWLALQGKCRKCKKEISVQYPLVELGTGFLFGLIGMKYLFPAILGLDSGQARMTNGISTLFVIPASLSVIPAQAGIQSFVGILGLAFWLFFASALMVIFVYDLKHQIIPDEVVYPALIAGLAFVLLNFSINLNTKFAIDHLFTALLAGGFFYSLAAVSNGKWMGGGDIKLAAFMGLVLGWQGMSVALYTAFVLGALVGVFALLSGKKKLGSKIPFGPFLVVGTFIGLFFAEKIISFYGRMFL